MYSDGDGDYGYVWYNGNDVQVNGVHGVNGVNRGNGEQYYVPNDNGGVILLQNTLVFGGNGNDAMILSPNTLVFGGNGRSPSGHRFEARQAVVEQRIQPSFRSVLEGRVSPSNAHGPQASSSLSSSSRNISSISGRRQRRSSAAGGQGSVGQGSGHGSSQSSGHSSGHSLGHSINQSLLVDSIDRNIDQILGNVESQRQGAESG